MSNELAIGKVCLLKYLGLILIGIVLVVALRACSPVRMLNLVTPDGGYEDKTIVPYADGARHSLDIYRAASPKARAPVIMFIYGGGWTSGEKGQYKFVADAFTTAGYDVVIPDYRLYPEATYPAFVEDVAAAFAKAKETFSNRDFVLIGHSAGAYNAMMLALAPSYLEAEGVQVCDSIRGVVGLSGPYGAIPLKEEPYISVFPDRMTGEDAPVNIASANAPPALLITGDEDMTVAPKQSEALAGILSEQGVEAGLKIYPGLNHIDPVRMLSRYFDGAAPVKDDILAWLDGLEERTAPTCG